MGEIKYKAKLIWFALFFNVASGIFKIIQVACVCTFHYLSVSLVLVEMILNHRPSLLSLPLASSKVHLAMSRVLCDYHCIYVDGRWRCLLNILQCTGQSVPLRNKNCLVQNVKSAEVENSYIDSSERRSSGGKIGS